MLGTLRLLLAAAILVAASYGLAFIWNGELWPHAAETAASFGVAAAVVVLMGLVTRPFGRRQV